MKGELGPLRLEMLGSLRVRRGETELPRCWPKQQAVLVALALHPDQVVARDRLVDAVWGDHVPRSAVSDLHTYLSKLRRLLNGPAGGPLPSPSVLVSESGGYRLRISPAAVDAIAFERDLAAAARLRTDGDHAAGAATLACALTRWRGTALTAVPGPFADTARQRLEELRVGAAEDHADLQLALGQHALVTPDLFTMVHDHPLRERPWSMLMVALYRSGRVSEALAAFQELRRLFIEEMGIEPSDALHRLNNHIIAADPVLDLPRAYASATVVPNRIEHRADSAGPSRPPRPPAELPHAVADFVGRQETMRQIEAAYADGMLKESLGSATVVALAGMAGIGKTALAIRWAQQHADRFPDGQLYVNLRGHDPDADPLPPTIALTRFLRALAVMPNLIPVDVDEQASLFRSLVAGRRLLIVLDNAASQAQIEPLQPGSSGCMVIVTSRLRLSGLVRRCGARSIPVSVLEPEESLTLLRSIIGADRVDAEPDSAREICALADQLPLALRIVAAGLADDPYRRLADAVRTLSDGDRLAMAGSDHVERSAVRAAFDVSYRALQPSAQWMFRLLGLIPGPDFCMRTAAAMAQTSHAETAGLLDVLVAANLLDRQPGNRFQLHDLLRLYAAENAAKEDDKQARTTAVALLLDWYTCMIDAVTHSYGVQFLRLPHRAAGKPPALPALENPRSAVRLLETERPNLLAAIHGAAGSGHPEAAWNLADALRGYFRLRPYGSEWVAAATAGLEAANRAGDVRAQAAMYLSLADAYQALGQLGAALLHDSRALATSTAVSWTEGRASALSGLGRLHWTTGDLDQAAHQLTQALDTYRAISCASGQAACLGSLGRTEHDRGHLRAALALYREADALNRRACSCYGVALSAFYLGAAYRDLGRYEEAEAHLRRALSEGRTNGLTHAEALAAAYLAALRQDTGSEEDADELLAEARRLADRTGDRRVESECRNVLAEVLRRLGRTKEAVAEFDAAWEAAESTQYMRGRIRAVIGLAAARGCASDKAGLPATADDLATARRDAERAWELCRSHGYRLMQAEALCVLAELGRRDGTGRALARKRLREAETLSRTAGYRPGTESVRRLRAQMEDAM